MLDKGQHNFGVVFVARLLTVSISSFEHIPRKIQFYVLRFRVAWWLQGLDSGLGISA